jgi:hypothetical protein
MSTNQNIPIKYNFYFEVRCFNQRQPIEFTHLMLLLITVVAMSLHGYPSFFSKDELKIIVLNFYPSVFSNVHHFRIY